ncbi:MAG: hypothetical protein GEU71_09370 [Actinobacteria bacterium]|nr:hypothetical protein [Actinomycetota bacterium]
MGEYDVTPEDVRRSIRGTADPELRDVQKYLRIWEEGIQKTSESQGWRYFRTLRRMVEDELLDRNEGLQSLEGTDVCRLVATFMELRDKAALKPTPELPPGPAAFWGRALVHVDQELRARRVAAGEIEREIAALPGTLDAEIRKLLG